MSRSKIAKVLLGFLIVAGLILFFLPSYVKFFSVKGPELTNQNIKSVVLYDKSQSSLRVSKLLNAESKNIYVFVLWATWCGPCVDELKFINQKQKNLRKKGYRFVLVNYDSGPRSKVLESSQSWLKEQNSVLETFYDFDEQILEKFSISAFPFSIFADSSGNILKSKLGTLESSDF